MILGDRLEGYYASGTQQAVWIRFAGNTPAQAYVGTYSGSRLTSPGRGPNLSSQELRGVYYALSSTAGGNTGRNAWGFHAWGGLQPNPLPPNTKPIYIRQAGPSSGRSLVGDG